VRRTAANAPSSASRPTTSTSGAGEGGGGGGLSASSNRRRPSSSATFTSSPRSTRRIASCTGTHTARMRVDVGMASAPCCCAWNAASSASPATRGSLHAATFATTWCACVARATADTSPPSHRASARASGRAAPCGESITDSTVSGGRIAWPPAVRSGSGCTW
jgi:hypothetical protein